MTNKPDNTASSAFAAVAIPDWELRAITAVLQALKELREENYIYSQIQPADNWPNGMQIVISSGDHDFESRLFTSVEFKNRKLGLETPVVRLTGGEEFFIEAPAGKQHFKDYIIERAAQNHAHERRQNLRQFEAIRDSVNHPLEP